ncbi:MAG: DUF4890 domain-containing protein [Cytophagales bacterium]|nr:DUF4890 domain-containing protein [Cytophagales bacterium]
MKKLILMGLLVSGALITNAQRPQKENVNPVERAKKHTAKMKEELGLSEEQYQKVLALNEDRAAKMEERREAMKAQREEMKAEREAFNGELKSILTEDQFKALEAKKSEMRKKHGDHHRKRGPHKRGMHMERKPVDKDQE